MSSNAVETKDWHWYRDTVRARRKGGEYFISHLAKMLEHSNPCIRWFGIKELQLLAGRRIINDESIEIIEKLDRIEATDFVELSYDTLRSIVPSYYIESTDYLGTPADIAKDTKAIIADPMRFKEPLVYFSSPTNSGLDIAKLLFKSYFKTRSFLINYISDERFNEFNKLVKEHFIVPSDYQQFTSDLFQHGIFADRFFKNKVRERVARKYSQEQFTLSNFSQTLDNSGRITIDKETDAISRILDRIIALLTLDVRDNKSDFQVAKNWLQKASTPSKCVLCGNTFTLLNISSWVYFGSNGYSQCCFKCRIVEYPEKTKLLHLIPEFLEICNFIPNTDASPTSHSFTSRFDHSQLNDVFKAYGKIGGIGYVSETFGSWFHALVESGALPGGVQKVGRGYRCIANDGHLCASLDELYIDNWLSCHNIDHEREPYYPQHPTLNASGRRRADWLIGNTFVEYFGLVGNVSYEKKMTEKMLLSEKEDIDLISIFPSDMKKLNQILSCFI